MKSRVWLWVVLVVLVSLLAYWFLSSGFSSAAADEIKPVSWRGSGDFILCGKTWVNLNQVAVYKPAISGGCEILGPAGTVIAGNDQGVCSCVYEALRKRGEIVW